MVYINFFEQTKYPCAIPYPTIKTTKQGKKFSGTHENPRLAPQTEQQFGTYLLEKSRSNFLKILKRQRSYMRKMPPYGAGRFLLKFANIAKKIGGNIF